MDHVDGSFAGVPGWIMSEYRADLGDARLNARLLAIGTRLSETPASTPIEAFQIPSEKKAFYRFVENPRVDPERILAGHRETTLSRLVGCPIALAIQDTTTLNYTRRKSTQALGLIGSGDARGLVVHSCLAIRPDGTPLGLLSQDVYARPVKRRLSEKDRARTPIEDKESVRWRDTLTKISNYNTGSTKVVTIMDREGDIYDVYRTAHELNSPVLIRSCYSRRLDSNPVRYLWDEETRAPLAGVMQIEVARAPNRPARKATLEVRHASVVITPPQNRRKNENLPSYAASIVFAREKNPPEGEDPILWRLVTTLKITTYEEACELIRWYSRRWQIERFHMVLKSGCGIEELQLERADNIKRALAILSIQAQRVLYLTHQARAHPDAPASTVFSPIEILAIRAAKPLRIPRDEQLTLRRAVRAVAQLGGFMGRKSDGEPGVKTIWRGLRNLEQRALGAQDAIELVKSKGRNGQR